MSEPTSGTFTLTPAALGQWCITLPVTAEGLEAQAKRLEDQYHEVRNAARDPLSRFPHEPPLEWLKDAAMMRLLASMQRQIDELKARIAG